MTVVELAEGGARTTILGADIAAAGPFRTFAYSPGLFRDVSFF